MNRIFKVIYSKTKHMYVVASELAKSHRKGKNGGTTSGRALAALVMAALASMSFMAAPMTVNAINDSTAGENNTSHNVKKHSWVVAGNANDAEGINSVILGGNNNITFDYKIDDDHTAGDNATVLGGYRNYAIGVESVAGGGWGGLATGENSTKLGGWNGVVQGIDSTGIAGGSTGDAARYALAMGYGAVVTNDGATPVPSTGTPNATNVATALGYEATANAPGTIAVGHDKGDASGWTVTYAHDSYGNIDTTKAPTITAKDPYTESYYNRIVKMADGIDSHDAVTMEQMTTNDNTKANVAADNIGSKLKVADGTDSKTGLPAMKDASDAEKTANETAWGTALGTGSIAKDNGQLVTGGTVYTAMLGKADTNLSNITNAGHQVIYKDAQSAVSLVDGTHTTVSSKMNGDTKEYAVNIATGQVASGDGNLVTGGTVYDAIQNAKISGGSSTVDITGKADVTAGNVGRNFSKFSDATEAITDADKKKAAESSEITANENNWGHALGTGSVADSTASDADTNGSKQLVTGGTVYSAIQNTAVWKLSANGDTSGAATIKPGSTVDFSASADGKDGTKDHSNVVISKDTDSSNVKIGLSNNIVIGEKTANKGGSLSVYRDPSDAAKENGDDQLGSHISIDGSTMSIRYDNGTAASDARGLVLGVANDSYTDTDKKTVSSPLGYMYLQDGSNYYYIHGTMHNDPTALQGRLVYNSSATGYNYVANIDDGIKFTGDIAKTTPGDTASAEAEANLNPISAGHTLNISGGVTRSEDLSDNNIGVVATGTTYKDVTKSTVDKAGSLSIKLAKDLKGITSIGNQTTSNDTTTGAKITMGTDGTTTISGGDVSVASNKITNVKSGLTATDGTYADTDKNNAANIGDVHSMITKEAGTTDTKLALKANVAADNIGTNLKGSDGNAASTDDQTANEEKWGEAIGTGSVASGDKKLVSGGTVYTETHPTANGNYIKAADSAATNLTALDTQVHTNATNIATNTGDITNLKNLSNITDAGKTVIKNLAKDSVKVINGTNTTVSEGTDGDAKTYAVNVSNDAIKGAVKDDLDKKANVDASNITGENLTKWQNTLGTGNVASKDTGLVTGGTVYSEVRPTTDGTYIKTTQTTGQNLSALDTQVHTNATNIANNATNIATNTTNITNLKNLSNITDAGETVIKNLAKGAVKVTAGNRVTVGSTTDEKTGTITYTVSANNDGKVEKGNTDLVSGDTVNTAINSAIDNAGKTTDNKLALKANVAADNIGKNLKGSDGNAASTEEQTANEEKWGEAIGTGAVASGDKKLVTGGIVYDALHGGLDNITVGKDGKDGKDGSIGIAGKDGKDGYTMTIIKTEQGAAGVDGKDGITRVIYQDKDGQNKHTMATLDDGLKFKGDDRTVIAKKLDEQLDITGGADSTKLTDGNIGVNSTTDGSLKIQLAKDLTGITSITSRTTDSAAGGKITFSDKGTTISGGDVSVDNHKITNLAPGTAGTDAATVKQVNDVDAKADANSAAIKTNANNIEKNGKAIEKNSAAIKTNADNIEKNGKAIEKNSAAIKTNADNIEKNGKAIEQNSAAIKTNADNIEKNGKAIEQNSAAIKTNADNIEKNGKAIEQNSAAIKTNADNIEKNGKAIEKNSAGIKTNSDNIEKNGKAIEQNSAAIKTNSDNIEKISKTVEQTTFQVAENSSNIEKNGKAIEQNSAAIRTNSDNIEKNSAAIESLGQNKADIDASNIGKNLKDADGKAASADAVKANEDAWGGAIGTGKVESGNKQLVTGDTVYNELRPTSDGSYIRKDSTTAQNLASLDTQVKKTADLINSNGETIKIGGSDAATKIDVSGKDSGGTSTARIITGVQTDADDPASAANVGYVNEVSAANTQQIYRDMNSAYGHLNNNINKAAAGSNALAALHPLDYDPGDKASYAVGFGHYRNANAAAVGAFYQPNANTMVSVGVSMGNGDPGVNAGVSFKVGKGSTFNGVSKAQMAETIAAQEKQISEIKASDVAKDKRIDSLEKENQEMKKQIQEILAKLGQ